MKPKKGCADSDESDPEIIDAWKDAHEELDADACSDAPEGAPDDIDDSGEDVGPADPHASRNIRNGDVVTLVFIYCDCKLFV